MPPVKKLSYSASLVSQREHRFYTLTMPSDVLATTCFVSAREEDPVMGFQRLLDEKRAKEIATYIDSGFGTIPTSIILSAQDGAQFNYVRHTKTVEFLQRKNAFLIIDGQHRVYGFSLAKASLRVPVVVYNGLSRRDETRLFIDINTKQRPVPNELLLDIKSLAEYESDAEQRLRNLFDLFNGDTGGPLHGLLSPTARQPDKISRVTFNTAVKPLLPVLGTVEDDAAHEILSAYLAAIVAEMASASIGDAIIKTVVFKSIMKLFSDVAPKVKDRHGSSYTLEHFAEALAPLFASVSATKFKNPGGSVKDFHTYLKRSLDNGFQL
jgi:DGQHR domain-containing protein